MPGFTNDLSRSPRHRPRAPCRTFPTALRHAGGGLRDGADVASPRSVSRVTERTQPPASTGVAPLAMARGVTSDPVRRGAEGTKVPRQALPHHLASRCESEGESAARSASRRPVKIGGFARRYGSSQGDCNDGRKRR